MYQNIKCHFLLPQVDNRNRVVFLVIFKVCVIKRLTAKRWMARKISELKLDYLDPSHFMNLCGCLHIPNSFSQLLTDADIWKTVIICLQLAYNVSYEDVFQCFVYVAIVRTQNDD